MRNAVAFANNDVVIAWGYGAKPEGCMGFALYRIDTKGKETALRSHAVFPGGRSRPDRRRRSLPFRSFTGRMCMRGWRATRRAERDRDLQPRSYLDTACVTGT
jgi:hypothetical protein